MLGTHSTYPKGGVSCFLDNEVLNQSFVLRMKFSGKNPALRVAANRYRAFEKTARMTKEFPIIKTTRLFLRQFQDSDLDNVFKGLSNPDIIKYYGISFNSLEATKEQMTWFSGLEKNETGIWWAVCSFDNKDFYGAGGLNNLNKEYKKAEIGFWLLPNFWRQGIMTEAMSLIVNYAFDNLGLHRIEGFVETENKNCKKALAKIKFAHEGTMQDCEIKNGKFISLDIYAKVNKDE